MALIPSICQLPPELIAEILLYLPHESLVRFSTVSKSWNSLIFDPVFARKQKNRAVLLRRHRLVVCTNPLFNDDDAAVFSLAPISSDLLRIGVTNTSREYDTSVPFYSVISNPKVNVRDYAGQFEGKPYILAFCDELCCVAVKGNLFLWNPSMRNNVQVPTPPSFALVKDIELNCSSYGLAYDSINDDYKILKTRLAGSELYSLKHDCWREFKPFSPDITSSQSYCAFVGGRFHWIGIISASTKILASFDLSTDMYGTVALPPYADDEEDCSPELEVVTLRGMLCVSVNYFYYDDDGVYNKGRFALWVMEEYGVEKSWTKKFDILLPCPELYNMCLVPEKITPLHFSDDDDELLVTRRGCCAENMCILLMYRNGEARPMWEFLKGENDDVDAFLYVESLIKIVRQK